MCVVARALTERHRRGRDRNPYGPRRRNGGSVARPNFGQRDRARPPEDVRPRAGPPLSSLSLSERRHHYRQIASSIITYRFVFWRRRRQLFILFHKMASVAACIRASQACQLSAAAGSARRPQEHGAADETVRPDGTEVAAVETGWMLGEKKKLARLQASGNLARSASPAHCGRGEAQAPRAGDGRRCECPKRQTRSPATAKTGFRR